MQIYINPIELLNLDTNSPNGLDGSSIRKAKKSLLAEIELSDTDNIIYNSIELTKSDCIKAIDDLDHKDKRDFHLHIFNNSDLSHYLTSGDLNFFKTFKTESIYKLQDFIDFISPYFSSQYAKVLSSNFKANNFNNVKAILLVKPIVNDVFFEDCYKTTYVILKEIENDILKLTKEIEIKNSEHFKNGFCELPKLINQIVNVDLINLLPSYFQSMRNQLAQSVRNLARDLNNDPYNKYKPAFEIIEIANTLLTDGLVKQTITKGYYTIKKNYEDSIPKTTKSNNQQSSPTKNSSIKLDDKELDDSKNKNTKSIVIKQKSNDVAYFFFLTIAFAIGFLYSPIQKIILSVSLLVLLIPLIAFRKDDSFSIDLYIEKNIIFIGVASLGLFYEIFSQIYISYYFLFNLNLFFCAISKKSNEKKIILGFWHYTIGAIILTILYFNYVNDLKLFLLRSNITVDKQLNDKDCFQQGSLSFNQSNFKDAIGWYDLAIEINPNYFEAYGDRGACKANLGQYEGAILDYQKAEELGMKTSLLYSNWGYSYYQLKEIDNALNYFEKAIAIDSNNANAYRGRGDIRYDNDDNKGAEQDYTMAITLKPNASNYFVRGLAFYYLKDFKNAIADFDKAIQLNPDVAQYYNDRGDAKNVINDFDGACYDWQIAKAKGYNVPDSKIKRCVTKFTY